MKGKQFIKLQFAKNIPKKSLLLLIESYRYIISPLLGQNCRFYPSCSAYAKQAISHYGVFKGALLTISRLARCQPWGQSGYDPVPTEVKKK